MREKSNSARSLFWRIMISVVLIVGAGAFAPHIQAQGRRGAARARNHNRGAAAQSGLEPRDRVSLAGECRGTIIYQGSEPGSVEEKFENATIYFRGDKFEITGATPALAAGKLFVVTRSRSQEHLSLSVNLTFDSPSRPPVFSLSLRGCYNRSGELCDKPGRGQGRIDKVLRLNTVKGDLRRFSFESDSCTSEPQISKMTDSN